MPRKKLKGGRKNLKAKKIVETLQNSNDENFALRAWVENVNRNKDDFQINDELEEIDDISINEEEFEECNLKELEKPLRSLLRKFTDTKIKKIVKIECEWKKCTFETLDENAYYNHVADHLNSICTEGNGEITCHWDLCNFSTEHSDEFVRHLNYHAYHTTLKTFGYGLCQIVNIPVCQRDSKFRNIIPELDKYFCHWEQCEVQLATLTDFITHVNHHIEEYRTNSDSSSAVKLKDVKVVCCWEGCKKILPNIFELKRHSRIHTNQKVIGCSNCGHLFSTKLLFINHCVRQVVGQRTFKCPECVKFYPSEKLLKEHVRSHVNKFQCSICGLSCQKKSVLARHIRYRHMDNRSFACDQCKYKGTTQADLDSHLNKHKKGDFFKCDVFQCNYSCRTLMALKRHDAREHLGQPQTYVCHIHRCSKKFLRGYLLTKHLKADHDFILAPGHSRFIYKLDDDGFYRLQTKRVENLKESCHSKSKVKVNANVKYTIERANEDLEEGVVEFKVQSLKNEKDLQISPMEATESDKDIENFTVMRNYLKIIKK